MGEVQAKGDRVERHALHDLHTVSMLTDHLVFSPKYRGKVLLGEVDGAAEENLSLEKKALPKKQEFSHLREGCPGHLWAPSCYHKTFKRSFIKNASQSVGHG